MIRQILNEASFIDTQDKALDVVVKDRFAYLASSQDGLRIIDVSDPFNPSEAGFFDTGDNAWGVVVNGNFAYVADGEDGLYIFAMTS